MLLENIYSLLAHDKPLALSSSATIHLALGAPALEMSLYRIET
jgi:hypothetical protein